MRKWAASGLVAAYLLALLVRLSPLARYPFWGSDAGEYYRIAQDLLAGGHVSVAYSGWGATYPWFPGMFFVVDGLAFAGADLPAALNLGIPALGAFLVVPIFLVVGPRLRDDRAALLAAALVAVAMPHAYPTSHAIPATLGDLLVFSVLAMSLRARRDRRWLLLIGLVVPALVVTHHLSTYFLAIALLLALALRALLNPLLPLREVGRDAAVFAYVLGSSLAFWFGYAAPLRNLIIGEIELQPWWLLFVAMSAGLVGLAALIAVRRRFAVRYRPAVPDLRHGVAAYGFGLAATLTITAAAMIRAVPGTTIFLPPLVGLWFLPLFVLIAFSAAGRKAFDFVRDGADVSGWFLAFVLSAGFGALAAPRVLIPYRHIEYVVVPLAIFAGLGFVRTIDLAGLRRASRGAAVAATVVLLATAAAGAIPPPSLIANYNEGFNPRALDTAYWARAHIPGDALVAADHRSSSALFGFGRVNATWDRARLTLLASSFPEAKSEMESVPSPSGERRVDFVLIDTDTARGAQLFPWEPAYPLGDPALAKFGDPPFVKVFDSGYAQVYWVNWGLAA